MTSHRHNLSSVGPLGAAPETSPRDAYLDAARACILDVGWRRTTLTEVARRAGVSRMTIYRSWADMPTLLGDLMTREWTEVVTGTAPSYDDRPPTADELADLVVRVSAALRENELFVRIVEVDPELILPYLLSRRGRSQELIARILTEAIGIAQGAGTVRAGDPATMARALLLATHGFVLSLHTMVDGDVDESALEEEHRLLLTRMLAPTEGPSA